MKPIPIVVLLVLSMMHMTVRGEVASTLPLSNYQATKTWHEQLLAGNPDRQARTEALRKLVRASPYGERGLRRMFGNFEGPMSIDPTTPGVEHTTRLLNSSSSSQRKGYARELMYAQQLYNDGRNKLTGMNQPLKRPWGNTDADIVIQNRNTGLFGRVEIKEYSLASQVTNQKKLKRQMDKMALEGVVTGQPQYWINRRAVTPELKQYATRRNIVVLENIATGRKLPPGTQSFSTALKQIEQTYVDSARRRMLIGGAAVSFGAVQAMQGGAQLLRALGGQPPGPYSNATLREIGQYAASTVGGAGMVLAGGGISAVGRGSEATQTRVFGLSRIGGVGSILALGTGEGLLIARYNAGDISSKEFWTRHWTASIQAAGSASGTWLGRGLGSLTGNLVVGTSGGIVGGMVIGWLSGSVAESAADRYYEHRFGKVDQEFGEFVYQRYGVATTSVANPRPSATVTRIPL